ncbi:ribonuclease H-like domain-containing protein [Tanacetum coccineum]
MEYNGWGDGGVVFAVGGSMVAVTVVKSGCNHSRCGDVKIGTGGGRLHVQPGGRGEGAWRRVVKGIGFAKYQENRANGRQEKRIVAIEDSNSKALVATDNNEDIDWTKEFDAKTPKWTLAMMALTEVEQDDWSMEFDVEHVHFGQDGLGDFDWSNKADDTPVYQTERDNFQKARTEILGYQMSLESLEVILKTHEKNEYAWGDKYEQMEYDLKIKDLKLEEKQKELDQALKERDDFKVKLEKWSNASVLQNEVLNKQRYLSDKTCIGFGVESSSGMESDNSSGNTNSTESLYPNFQKTKGFHSVPPPTGTIIPPRANVSFTGIDELAIRNKGNPEEDLKDYAIIDSGCSGSMTGDKDKLSDFKELRGGYHNVLFTDKECLILSPKFKFVDEDLVILRAPRKNDVYSLDLKNIIPSGGITCLVAKATKIEAVYGTEDRAMVNFKNINKLVKGNLVRGLPSKTFKLDHSCLACRKGKQHRASCKKIEERTVREPLELLHMDCLDLDETYDMLHDLIVGLENKLRTKSIARTPQQNGVAERKNRTLIEAARTMLADSLLPIQFWAEAVNTACYVLNRVLMKKAILLGYSTNRKGFRVYNMSQERINDCLHLNFLENQEKQKENTAKTPPPPQSTGNTPTDSDDDVPKDGVFSTNSFDDEHTDTEEDGPPDYNNMITHRFLALTPHTEFIRSILKVRLLAKVLPGFKQEESLKKVLLTNIKHCCLLYTNKTELTTKISRHACLLVSYLKRNPRKSLKLYQMKVGLKHARRAASIQLTRCLVLCRFNQWKALIGTKNADSSFHLEAFSDSDYAGDNHDRRSTSGGCQYLGRRLVSWQCKKQTIVAISSIEAEYVAAASCCAQVLWMQN